MPRRRALWLLAAGGVAAAGTALAAAANGAFGTAQPAPRTPTGPGPGPSDGTGAAPSTSTPAAEPHYPVDTGFRLDGSPTFDAARARGTLLVGVVDHQPGLSEQYGDRWTGFDVEIARTVSARLGFGADALRFVPTATGNREEVIINRQVDLVISSYTINDKRQELISFAGPYYTAGQSILVRAGETAITGKDTLRGHRVCSVLGSAPLSRLELLGLTQKANIVRYPNNESCLTDLLNDAGVDAMTTDDTILIGLANRYPGQVKLVGATFSEEPYGIGLLRGDDALRCALDGILAAAIADGTWAAIFRATLGAQGIPAPAPPRPASC